MEYRKLGNSGLEVSVLGLGTNNFGGRADEASSLKVIDQALESGINFFDTANIYAATMSEQIIGKGLKGRRHGVVIGTKFGTPMGQGPNMGGGSRRHIMEQVEASLKRLQTDYIDLYYIHWMDPNTPIEETLRALDDLVRAGKVRYIGNSNFDAWRVAEAEWTARELGLNRFVCAQNHYNLLKRDVEREHVPVCRAYGIGLIPYFPLESGLLTGKYKAGEALPKGTRLEKSPNLRGILNDKNFGKVQALEQFAAKSGRSLGDVAHAWLLANPAVSSVISGATKPEQVAENAKGIDWKLTAEEMKELDALAPA